MRPAMTGGRAVLLFGALIPAIALLLAEAYLFDGDWSLPLDDGWIHLVFARSLAGGAGLAYGPGGLVAATTAPLWTAILGLLALLPGSPVLWAKIAGIAAQGATVLGTWVLARRLGLGGSRAGIAAFLVATTDWLVWSSLSAMEIPLFTALTLFGMVRHLDERRSSGSAPVSLLLFGLAALARPEGLLLPFLAVADRLLTFPARSSDGRLTWRKPALGPLLTGLCVALLVIVPVGLVFLRISGSPFPTTLTAKSSGPPIFIPEIRYLRTVVGILFPSQPWMTLLALGGAVEMVRRLGTPRDRGLLPVLWLLALPLGLAALSSGLEIQVGNFGRYLFPLFPLVVVLGSLALVRIPFRAVRATGGPFVAAAALVVLILPTLISLTGGFGRYLTSCANVRDSDVALARWLAPRLDPRAVLAVTDIGALQYFLPNRLIDMGGLVTPELNRLRLAGNREGRNYREVLSSYLEEKRPDFLIAFPEWFPEPVRQPERFPLQRAFEIRDNITMGGDMILVHATPWTRYPLAEPEAVGQPGAPPTAPRGTP